MSLVAPPCDESLAATERVRRPMRDLSGTEFSEVRLLGFDCWVFPTGGLVQYITASRGFNVIKCKDLQSGF
jgi:hypothetical protein